MRQWPLLFFAVVLVACVTKQRTDLIQQFCLDHPDQCVPAVKDGKALNPVGFEKVFTTTQHQEEYDSQVTSLLEDYCDKYPWKCWTFKPKPIHVRTELDLENQIGPGDPAGGIGSSDGNSGAVGVVGGSDPSPDDPGQAAPDPPSAPGPSNPDPGDDGNGRGGKGGKGGGCRR